MFDLSSYITGLLFIHDCVILPGFGGFVANYQDAALDESSNTFSPPAKKLVFNSNLSYNDGLLINYLSRQLQITYEEAEQKVKQSVEDIWIRLEKGESVKLNGIGSFRYNEDASLVFEPQITENLLTDSYGLFSFRFPPLSYQSKNEQIINNDNIRRMPTINTSSILRYAAVLVPVAALIALIPYYNNRHQENAGFVSGSANMPVSIEDSVSALQKDGLSVDRELLESTNKRSALFYNETPVPATVAKKKVLDNCIYYIIGASFKDQANAEKYRIKYQKAGFDSEIVLSDDLYRVSLGSFDDKVKALHELRRIRGNEEYSKIWLYSKAR